MKEVPQGVAEDVAVLNVTSRDRLERLEPAVLVFTRRTEQPLGKSLDWMVPVVTLKTPAITAADAKLE